MPKLRTRQFSFLDWKGIDLLVDPGEALAIVGKSGSGKSLLLRAIADLIPWSGELSLDGRSCMEMEPTEWRRKVAFVASETLWWEETVGEHFESRPSDAALEELDLPPDCLEWSPTRLSMGERQRLGLLRALNNEPVALLLDEPTSNLDPRASQLVESLLLRYIEENRACALWVTHSEEQAGRVASRVRRMEEKGLQEEAS